MTIPEIELDIASVILRIEQVEAETPPDSFIWHRILTCDVPRLRGYLSPETLEKMDRTGK